MRPRSRVPTCQPVAPRSRPIQRPGTAQVGTTSTSANSSTWTSTLVRSGRSITMPRASPRYRVPHASMPDVVRTRTRSSPAGDASGAYHATPTPAATSPIAATAVRAVRTRSVSRAEWPGPSLRGRAPLTFRPRTGTPVRPSDRLGPAGGVPGSVPPAGRRVLRGQTRAR